uniref:Thiol:disulfi de interchange protein n=1 Tax=Yamadaella caenomyce TaxID=259029 RepID=A0A1G4NYI8_9FLOR|nr:Thiol:disulfi de interchange protein [Yamadaella caenomyce]SCW23705.1 Thiol:disulfi de interchange protein [Yamadaella caenomyce]
MITSQIYINIYNAEQHINNILHTQISQVTAISVFTAFMGGILASTSPCILYTVPVATLWINKTSNKTLSTAIVSTGAITSFMAIGYTSIIVKQSYSSILENFRLLWPIFIIAVGYSFFNTSKIPTIIPGSKKLDLLLNTEPSLLATYLFGLSLGITTSSCSTPITVTLITYINSSSNHTLGLGLMLIYSIGYISPFLLCTKSTNIMSQLSIISNRAYKIFPILGCSVITYGSFLMSTQILHIL